MSRKGISRLTLRLAVVVAVLACAMFACAGAAYAEGEGTIPEFKDGKYQIYNGDQFINYKNFAAGNQVYDSETGTYINSQGTDGVLKADIDLDTATAYWQPNLFQNESRAFTGTFDGQGHTITGFPTIGSNYYSTLFIYNKGTLKNFIIDLGGTKEEPRVMTGQNGNVGPACGFNYGVLSGITVKGHVSYPNTMYISMLCGVIRSGGIMMNCHTEGSVTGANGVSGLVSSTSGNDMIKNCYNAADVTNTSANNGAFALIRQQSNLTTVENCYNLGIVTRNGIEDERLSNYDKQYMTNCYTSEEMEGITAADLGDGYVDDLEGDAALNNGYPIFPFMITPDNPESYPHVEGPDDIVIDSIKSVNDTSLSAICKTKFEYYKIKTGDFAIRLTSETGQTATLAVTDMSFSKRGNLLLMFDSISRAKDSEGNKLRTLTDQDLTVTLLVGGKEAGQTSFHLTKSNYWTDYATEPVKVSKDDPKYGDKFSGYYKITKPEELAWVAIQNMGDTSAYEVDFKDNCFLANDIILNDTSNADWKNSDDLMIWDCPIGYSPSYGWRVFMATFDGNGHSVKGMYIDYKQLTAPARSLGLFGYVSGTVKNLAVEDAYIYAGGLNDVSGVGGIVGGGQHPDMENCSFSGEIIGGNYTAGVLGGSQPSNGVKIKNCVNRGTIKGAQLNYTAGIMCQAYYNTYIEDCYNVGKVTGAGIIANYQNGDKCVYLKNCYNAGECTYSIIGQKEAVDTDNVYSVAGCGSVSGNIDVVTEEEAKDGSLLEYLDSEEFVADDDNINEGYPILKWESPLIKGQTSYPEELDFYVDIDEYGMNKDLIQDIIDEAKDKIANAKSSAEADAAFNDAKATIDLIPNDEQVKQNMADKLAELEEQIREAERRYAFNACDIKLDNDAFVYTGEAFEPVVTVTDKEGKALVKDTDYEVKYEANTDPGFAKVTVTGKGEYSGEREVKFTITPAKAAGLKLKKAKKAFTAKWTKDEKAAGYEVSYSLKKNFKGAKTVKITKNTTVSKKVSKLKAKKKYFVRVRAYVTADEQTVYGAWSAVKSVKTK